MEFGVFMPVIRNGFLVSRNGPQFDPSFAHLRDITLLAEELELEFALALTKYKGSGGDTGFWDGYFDSFSYCMGLAPLTKSIRLIPSASTLANHPIVTAKMIAALDDASDGRAGLNIVTGWNKPEYVSMGMWPGDEYFEYRYDRAEEYITIVNDLLSTGHATLHGEYYDIEDAECLPVPRNDIPTVCAGLSPRGAAFVGEHVDISFVCTSVPNIKITIGHSGAAAKEAGRAVSTIGVFCIVPGETDDEARARVDHIVAGLDEAAAANIMGLASVEEGSAGTALHIRKAMEAPVEDGNIAFFSVPVICGSDATIARRISEIQAETGLSGMMLTFIDWIDDLRWFGERIKPLVGAAVV